MTTATSGPPWRVTTATVAKAMTANAPIAAATHRPKSQADRPIGKA